MEGLRYSCGYIETVGSHWIFLSLGRQRVVGMLFCVMIADTGMFVGEA